MSRCFILCCIRCVSVTAVASSGVVAEELLGRQCEDTITLMAEWENISDGSTGHATYTASWTAAKADVHSQQRFFCLMQGGEVTADQVDIIYSIQWQCTKLIFFLCIFCHHLDTIWYYHIKHSDHQADHPLHF